MYKRKHRRDDNRNKSARVAPSTLHVQPAFNVTDAHDVPTPNPSLYIQAYEADVICGPPTVSARALEFQDPSAMIAARNRSRSGLVRWGTPEHAGDTDTADVPGSSQPSLWVDRYDVRLLLDHLPNQLEITQVGPPSPSGWSDLPSDSDDIFFFSPDEVEDYRREKRRRLIDRSREERLRVLAVLDGEDHPDPWGGSDEEPDETQRKLIRRTAAHIISSPNPAQLEMRILANYGNDQRFAFLRGRWSRVWKTEKERAKQHQAADIKEAQFTTTATSLGGLANYGDSDSDNSASADTAPTETLNHATGTQGMHSVNEDAVKEARRTKAREWSARRRAEQSAQP